MTKVVGLGRERIGHEQRVNELYQSICCLIDDGDLCENFSLVDVVGVLEQVKMSYMLDSMLVDPEDY